MNDCCYPIEKGRGFPVFRKWVLESETYLIGLYYDYMNLPLGMMGRIINVTSGVWLHHKNVVFMN